MTAPLDPLDLDGVVEFIRTAMPTRGVVVVQLNATWSGLGAHLETRGNEITDTDCRAHTITVTGPDALECPWSWLPSSHLYRLIRSSWITRAGKIQLRKTRTTSRPTQVQVCLAAFPELLEGDNAIAVAKKRIRYALDGNWPTADTIAAYASVWGLHPGAFYRPLQLPGPDAHLSGRPWTAEDDAEILALIAEGHTHREVGEMVGRTKSSVMTRACRISDA